MKRKPRKPKQQLRPTPPTGSGWTAKDKAEALKRLTACCGADWVDRHKALLEEADKYLSAM